VPCQEGDYRCISARVPHGDSIIGDEPSMILEMFHSLREFVEEAKD